MKKQLSAFALALTVAASSMAAPAHFCMATPSLPKNGQKKETLAKVNPQNNALASRSVAAAHQWVDLGLCDYVDDIATGFFNVEPSRYKVKVLKDEANPGIYKIVNLWANYPLKEEAASDPYVDACILPEGDEYYILLDASNPDYVRMLESPIGMDDGYGAATAYSLTELVGELVGYSILKQEDADKSAGKLADNVITFPVGRSIALLQDGVYYAGNSDGAFALALPGGSLGVDYTLSLQQKETFCPDENGLYHITVEGDSHIESVYYALSTTLPETVSDDFAATATKVDVNSELAVNVSNFASRVAYALFVAYDGNGEVQHATALQLDVPFQDTDSWMTLGKADLTEGFMSCVFPTLFNVETYEVDVECRTDNKNVMRIVNPYSGAWSGAQMCAVDHSHNHYIYINAENPENVFIERSALGITIPTWGDCAITSDYADMIDMYGLDFLVSWGIYSGGHLVDNVITFDETCDIKIYPYNYGKWVYTNLFVSPSDEDEFIAGDFKLDLNKAMSGIENVLDTNTSAPAELYNLQGVRTTNTATPGIYIVRQGAKVTKRLVK